MMGSIRRHHLKGATAMLFGTRSLCFFFGGIVPPAITARPTVFRVQLSRVRKTPDEGRFPRKQDGRGYAENTRTRAERTQRASNVEGTSSPRNAEFEQDWQLTCSGFQRQTVIGQFYQLDRLVIEAGISVCDWAYLQ